MQSELDLNIGEAVRNATFHGIVEPKIGERKREIYEIILASGEKGITARGIQKILIERKGYYVELGTFSCRLTELANPKNYDKPRYCNPPLIEELPPDIDYDTRGCSHSYTIYRAKRFTL